MTILERAADANHRTIKVNVYCTNMADYVAVYLSGPGMYGGQAVASARPTAWEYPPSGSAPGLVLTTDVVVQKSNFYRVEAHAGSVKAHYDVQLGKPDENQMGRDIDLDAAWEKTPQGRMEVERRKVRDMMRPTGILGSPRGGKRVRMPGRVPRS
jgi:hypothetical protein